MPSSEEQIARNEVLFRDINERVEDVAEDSGLFGEGEPLLTEFLCECGGLDCVERIELTRTQYESVRSNPRRFAVLAGHEDPHVATVVERQESFLVVEKRDEAAQVAEEHDPRRRD